MLRLQHFYVVNSNIEAPMSEILEALFHRRAVKAFEPVEIPQVLREQILDAARPCSLQFQYATVPLLLGGIVAQKGNRGETLPWTDACGNGVGAGGCGGRHRLAGSDLASPVGVDAQERIQPRQSPRLRADGEDRPDPVHARTVRHSWRGQVGDFPTGEFVEDDRDGASVSTGLVKMGDEKYIVGL